MRFGGKGDGTNVFIVSNIAKNTSHAHS